MEAQGRAKRILPFVHAIAFCSVGLFLVGCSHGTATSAGGTWDPKAAAAYLDRRMEWWISWKNSARDHGTFCFSCHTAVPYALARPALGTLLEEPAAAVPEQQLMDDVRRRVSLWNETSPFYTDQYVAPGKSAQSRGTEAVLSALMLAWDDAHRQRLSADTVTAFDHLWAEQRGSGDNAGAWSWLDFELSPWEVRGAEYYGAALAALAVGVAPGNYQARPEIQEGLQRMRAYLVREYEAQSLHHRVILLWASMKLPGLLDAAQRRALVAEVLHAQNRDGGWSLSALLPSAGKDAPRLTHADSDGYATGLVTFVLGQVAMPEIDAQVQRGASWLVRNQLGHGGSWIRGQEGFWVARSVNKWRSPWSDVGRFMSDAATAYAVLALSERAQPQPRIASAGE